MINIFKYFLPGIIFCLSHFTIHAQNKKIDLLLTLLKKDSPDTQKVNHLENLFFEYQNMGLYDIALYYNDSASRLAEKLNFKRAIIDSYRNAGIINGIRANYPKALEYFLKTLKMLGDNENSPRGALTLDNIGMLYGKQGDYSKALDYHFKALKIAEALSNKKAVSIFLGNIGEVYIEQGDFNLALDYFFKALKMQEKLGTKKSIIITLGNIGIAYFKQGNYSKALDYFFKGMKMSEELGDKNSQATYLDHIGSVYAKTGKFKEAEQFMKRAIAKEDSIGILKELMEAEKKLSELYDTMGHYQLSLEYYKKAISLQDTIFSQEDKKQLVRKEMNFEFEKTQAVQKAEQEKKDVITSEEKQRQKVIIYSVSAGLFLVLLLALFIFRGYQQKQKANTIITRQKVEVENQKALLENKNKEITDSINYAKRIQQAKLPNKKNIYAALPHSFVLFKPKDIVSGDFYFFHATSSLVKKNRNTIFMAAADCTGHGVPGALMSMIGSEKLEDAVSQTTDTSEILQLLNIRIKSSLQQSETNASTRDGMDIALVSIGPTDLSGSTILNYAGANRPIWIIRKGQSEIEEIKATKKAIAGFTENNQHFETHKLKLSQGDTFYIFTDGYADQFGGEEGKKLMTKRFRDILLGIQDKSMEEQEKQLDIFMDNWRGNREQIDDILVIGVRV